MAETIQPDTPSSSYVEMLADWQMVRAIRGGAKAVREAGEAYLPRFADEDPADYATRLKHAPFSAHYEDATRTLVGKPFSKEVKLQGQIPDELRQWSENVDYAGHNLHTVSKTIFEEGLHLGLCFIYVDFTSTGQASSLGEERRMGARPYFRIIPADDMLAIHEGVRNGQTYIRQIRFIDNELEIVGIEEKLIKRVRQVDDVDGALAATLWQEGEEGWTKVADQSDIPLKGAKLSGIPVVPVIFGSPLRSAFSIKPPMLDLAYKQIEHYQHASRLANIFDFAGFPILQAKGMAPMMEIGEDGKARPISVRVGPRSVLYSAPANQGDRPEWGFIEPTANTIKEVREHLKDLESEMRTLGLQPSMPSVGMQNMAATTSAINAARTHSAVQAWALALKDALEQAFVFMAQWVGLPTTTEVDVFTDFSAEVLKDADEKVLLEARTLGFISWDTWADEMQRRDLLGPAFDKAKEKIRLANDDPLGMGTGEEDDDKPGEAA